MTSGDDITGTDFLLFETIDKYTVLEPTIIEHDNLKDWMKRIRDLPTLQKYFSDANGTRSWPLNNKMAAFK